jgi:hypothetical protein
VGRSRKRARRLAASGEPLPPPVVAAPSTAHARPERAIDDPEWRRAERRRIARLNRLPDPFRSWGDRSRGHAFAVAVLQMLLVIAVTLPLLRLTTGQWLPPYAAVVALALAVVTQAVCRSVNRRADERAARAGDDR